MPYLIFTNKSKRRVTDADAEGDLSVVCALLSERTVSQSPHAQPLGTAVFMCRMSCISFHRNTPFRSASRNCSSVGLSTCSSLCMWLLPSIRAPTPAPTRFLEILSMPWMVTRLDRMQFCLSSFPLLARFGSQWVSKARHRLWCRTFLCQTM
jgi:hypothetical protein